MCCFKQLHLRQFAVWQEETYKIPTLPWVPKVPSSLEGASPLPHNVEPLCSCGFHSSCPFGATSVSFQSLASDFSPTPTSSQCSFLNGAF